MITISSPAIAWLDHHRMGMGELNREAAPYGRIRRKFAGKRTMVRNRIDDGPEDWPFGKGPQDKLVEDGRRWLLDQHFGRFQYRELKTGHAKLVLDKCQLTETACRSLYGSGVEIGAIVELPDGCMVRDSGAIIIRAANLAGNRLEFLLRVEWHSIEAAAVMLEILR